MEAQGVLPVYTEADGFCRLPIGKRPSENCITVTNAQPPRRDGGASSRLEELLEVLVSVDATKHVSHLYVDFPFGEGGSSDTGCIFEDGADRLRVHRHSSVLRAAVQQPSLPK